MGLPVPDLVLYLDVPTELTDQMLRRREHDTHTHADIHEQNMDYLRRCRATGLQAAKYYAGRSSPAQRTVKCARSTTSTTKFSCACRNA